MIFIEFLFNLWDKVIEINFINIFINVIEIIFINFIIVIEINFCDGVWVGLWKL